MAKPSKSTFVCQNCGAVSPRWAGKCPACEEWNTLIEEADVVAPPGSGLARKSSGRVIALESLKGRTNEAPRFSTGLARARSRYGRRHRAWLRAANWWRAWHRKIDAASTACCGAQPHGAPRHLFFRRGGRRAGAPARRAARPCGCAGGARLRDQPRQHPSDARARQARRPHRRRTRSRPCGPRRSRPHPAPSARFAPPPRPSSATPNGRGARSSSSAT